MMPLMTSNSATPDTDSHSKLWRAARFMFVQLCALRETATAIAARGLGTRELARVRHFLHALETFVRKLILMEAGQIVLPDPRPKAEPLYRKTKRQQQKHERKPVFRLWSRPRPPPVRVRLLGEPTSAREIWRERRRIRLSDQLKIARMSRTTPRERLGRRIEALVGVLKAPQASARRLARQLARRPKLAIILAMARPWNSPYIEDGVQSLVANGSYDVAARYNDPRRRALDTS